MMNSSSLKCYNLYKPVLLLSLHPGVYETSSQILKNPWTVRRRHFVRVASNFVNKGNEQFSLGCKCKMKTHRTHYDIFTRKPNLRSFASVPDLPENSVNGLSNQVLTTLPQKIVDSFPSRYHPYLKLSRIDRPIGTWLLFWPSTWGLTVASGGMPDLALLALFGAGAFVMRGAGCTVNDMWDRHIDPRVKRTSNRPLAAGQIRMRHATVWLASQLSIAFGILSLLNPSCFLISCGALGLVCLYPLAKRVTHWPQAVLGLTFNTGILIGYAAATPLHTGFFETPYLDPACLSLYISGILWTLIYDTIYAHQDLQDDTLLGLGSTAQRFGESTKVWLAGFSGLMISSLTMTGIVADLSWPFFVGIGGVSVHLLWQIKTLNIKDATNCSERFNANRHIGWLILISLLASYYVKDMENSEQNLVSANSNRNSLQAKENVQVKYTRLMSSRI